jgi:hypothetical protein
MFGALAVLLGLYLVAIHAPPLVGRLPLYAYLWTLGTIAIVGGLIGSVAGQDLTDLPSEGGRVGDDLIVVRRSEWEARLGSVHPEPAPSSAAALPPVAVLPPLPDPASADWWEGAIDQLGAGVLPGGSSAALEGPDVLATLDAIERDAAPDRTDRPPRSEALRSPDPSVPALVPPPAPELAGAAAALIGRPVDDLDHALETLFQTLSPSGAPQPPSTPAAGPVARCVGCDVTLGPRSTGARCDACDQQMCAACLFRSGSGEYRGLCPNCTTLLDRATKGSG